MPAVRPTPADASVRPRCTRMGGRSGLRSGPSRAAHRLAAPGDDRELFQLAADVISRRLDRDRPLWEIWIIEGLSDNRWAMLTKIHHCMADGIAATHMLAGLCDDGIGESFASHIRAAKAAVPQGRSRGGRGVNPLNILGGLWSASTTITATALVRRWEPLRLPPVCCVPQRRR